MHTHLKGRIFNSRGVSYLVLQDDCPSPELIRVKELNAGKRVQEMPKEEVERHLRAVQPPSN